MMPLMMYPIHLGRLFLAIPAVLLLFVVVTALYNIYFHPLSRFPGPRLWAAFRFPWVLSMQRGDLHRKIHNFHEHYGSIVRIAPNELSFIDSRAWRDIYGNRPGRALFERNQTWLRKARSTDAESMFGPNEAAHSRLRKNFVQAFSDKAMKDHAPIVEGYVHLMIGQFKNLVGAGDAKVDLVKWFDFVTFDISGDLSFGEAFGCVKSGQAHPWVKISHEFGKGLALISSIGYYSPLDQLLRFIVPKQIRQKMDDHRAMIEERVQQRMALDTDRSDWFSAAVSGNKGTESALNVRDLDVNMSILVFAGSETTSSALSGIMRMLLQNQPVLRKLTNEIRRAFKKESDITLRSTGALELLNAVINEGMRLCPPVAIGVPRVSPKGGEEICAQWVAEGTYVTVNQFAAFRSKHNFEKPGDFVPERFLTLKDRQMQDDMSVFLPFSFGRHSCIGLSFAMAEMRLILARLVYDFDITLADVKDSWDWGEQNTFIFWQKRPLEVVLSLAQSQMS